MSDDRGRMTPLAPYGALFALVVWPLAAFGGRSATTAVPVSLACVAFALWLVRTERAAQADRGLNRALVALLAVVALQLVPLPAAIVAIVSPHAAIVRTALSIDRRAAGGLAPLTISLSDTAWAGIVIAGATALFWGARSLFGRGGVRRTVRMVSGLGFAVSLLAIAQAATAGRAIYWRFPTEFEGPLPFGPFVNRNHFATWAIMTIPLCLGYVTARSGAREASRRRNQRNRLARALDARTAWLMASAAALLVALLLSLSRSGMLALGIAAIATVVLCRHRLDQRRRRRVMAAAVFVLLCGVAWADIPALRARAAAAQSGLANRVTIWRETAPLVRDFWLTGTGAGTYQRAMFVYQRSNRALYFNQAHNHYLQVAAEGGLVLLGPVLIAVGAFVRTARVRLKGDTSGLFWIRAGAACGLGAVALQGVWETGLVMPANAVLAAVLAALVVHERVEDE